MCIPRLWIYWYEGKFFEVYHIAIANLPEEPEIKGSILTIHSVFNIPLPKNPPKYQVLFKKRSTM